MSTWVDVKERMPEIDTAVLGVCETDDCWASLQPYIVALTNPNPNSVRRFKTVLFENTGKRVRVNVTHWMPIPKIPGHAK